MEDEKDNSSDSKLLETYFDVFQHQVDVFVKFSVLFFAAIGTTAGFIYRGESEPTGDVILYGLIAILSIFAGVGCFICRRAVGEFEESVSALENRIPSARAVKSLTSRETIYPFSIAKRFLVVDMAICALFALASCAIGIVLWLQAAT